MFLCLTGCSSMRVDVTQGVKFDRHLSNRVHVEADCDRNDCKSQLTYIVNQKMHYGKIW